MLEYIGLITIIYLGYRYFFEEDRNKNYIDEIELTRRYPK